MKFARLFPFSIVLISLFVGFYISKKANSFLNIQVLPKNSPELSMQPPHDINPGLNEELDLRLFSLGGVGILPDTANWGSNYEHNSHRFEDVFFSTAPYIDTTAFRRIRGQLIEYIDHMASFGYNGILLGGYSSFIDFDQVENGNAIYQESDTAYLEHHKILRKYYGELMDIANSRGVDVYASTDMVALSPPLKRYFIDKFGKFDTEDPEFWAVYQAGLAELFEKMPQIKGLIIRIGEAGTVYNRPGATYTSELLVKTNQAVKIMIGAFLETAEQYDKLIIFRSWSVGVGEVGDMHTNPETYHKVFDDFDSEHLIISTKYCSGDFYAWLPFNPTLFTGKHKRIVELQCRREFEGMNAFPNLVAPLSQQAMQLFMNQNEHLVGLWVWPQSGGPLRAGPLSIYPFHGFNVITDANVYAHGRLLQNPNADLFEVCQDWAIGYFGEDSLLSQGLAEMLMLSHETTRKGLYISEFAQHDVRALGLEPPPMMWIFEWDLVGGSSSALGTIYNICKPNLEASIAEGYEAVKMVKTQHQQLFEIQGRVSQHPDEYQTLLASLVYQENLFSVLASYREFFLRYFSWLDGGKASQKEQWKTALAHYQIALEDHMARYEGNLDFPNYDFIEADRLVRMAENSGLSAWVARMVLLLSLAFIIMHLFKRFPFKSKPSLLWSLLIVLWIPGILGLTSFLALKYWIFTLLLKLTFMSSFLLETRAASKSWRWTESLKIMIPGMVMIALPLIISLSHGSMRFWYLFWTSTGFRTVFLSLFVGLIILAYYYLGHVTRRDLRWSGQKTLALILSIQGLQFIIGAAISLFIGFEKILTLFNDELLVLPGGLSKIMGITIHLDIPVELPNWILKTGFVLLILGLLLFQTTKIKRKSTDNLPVSQ